MANVSRQADEDLSWGADGMIFPDGLTLPETMGGSWPFEDCNEIFFPNDALVNSETRQMMITEASCLVHGMVIIGNCSETIISFSSVILKDRRVARYHK